MGSSNRCLRFRINARADGADGAMIPASSRASARSSSVGGPTEARQAWGEKDRIGLIGQNFTSRSISIGALRRWETMGMMQQLRAVPMMPRPVKNDRPRQGHCGAIPQGKP